MNVSIAITAVVAVLATQSESVHPGASADRGFVQQIENEAQPVRSADPRSASKDDARPTSRTMTPIDPRVDAVLTQLERRGAGLTDIRCKIRFVEDDRINLTKRTKTGELLFLITKPNPHFLIRFDKTEVDGVLGRREWYLFDGRWLYSALQRIKQVTKQEIARPGESIDLFDLEKAPFPLPFGQKKETILRNFDVTLIPPATGDPHNTDHLVCVPKPGSVMKRRYDKLEFFVRKNLHLPSRIIVRRNDGYEIVTTDFDDLSESSINAGVTLKDFARPSAWRGYQEVVEALPPLDPSTP